MVTLDELPSTAVHVILSYLPWHRDLAAFCLVSPRCYSLGFAKLHHTLYLGLGSQIELMISRIIDEKNTRPSSSNALRIGPCVRYLVFDDERYAQKHDREELICDDITTRFAAIIIPYFTELRGVTWKSHWLPRNTKIFKSLRERCPRLTSIEIFNYHYGLSDEEAGYTNSLYGFKNLKDIKIISERVPALGRRGVPPPIVQLIHLSPNLRALELTLDGTGSWSPNKLLLSVDLTFPNLRVLRFNGNLTTNWPILFGRPSAFLTFFEQHRSLHTISLGWIPPLGNDYTFEPGQMTTLFPSLRHFEGPSFLCIAIIKSSLALKLESLKILDLPSVSTSDRDDRPSINTVCDLAASAEALPMLRSVQFFVDPGTRASRVVHQLTRAAPELRELAINDVSLQQLKISESLHAPKLRKLSIKAGLMTPSRLRTLLDACPLLEELHDTYPVRSRRNWSVDHRPGGNVELKLLPEYQSE